MILYALLQYTFIYIILIPYIILLVNYVMVDYAEKQIKIYYNKLLNILKKKINITIPIIPKTKEYLYYNFIFYGASVGLLFLIIGIYCYYSNTNLLNELKKFNYYIFMKQLILTIVGTTLLMYYILNYIIIVYYTTGIIDKYLYYISDLLVE